MTPREGEEITLALFSALGLPLKQVPTNDVDSRPDFEATDGAGQRYVVETKTRFDSDDFITDLAEGRRAESQPRLDFDDATEKVIKKAACQLNALRASDGDITIACYVLAGFSPEMQAQQLRATLWGTIRMNDVFDVTFQTDCYYLGHTAFLKYRDLDAVAAVEPRTGRGGFYPNKFSPRRFEDTTLGRTLLDRGLIRTPEDAERHGLGVVVPVTTDGVGDFRSRLRAVQAKTGRRLSPMRSYGFQSGFGLSEEEVRRLLPLDQK